MRNITTTSGTVVEVDPIERDYPALFEAIWRDLNRRLPLAFNFSEVHLELEHLVAQMSEEEVRLYLREILHAEYIQWENGKLTSIQRRAIRTTEEA